MCIAIECAIKDASEFYLFPDSVLPIIIRLIQVEWVIIRPLAVRLGAGAGPRHWSVTPATSLVSGLLPGNTSGALEDPVSRADTVEG